MGLSNEPLTFAQDYRTLAHSTSEGNYVNIVNNEKADSIAEQFFSSMDVYPSTVVPVIKEFFHTI